eukprot:CAMPEP_0184497262 /NCGR_PEP_ID=MMETSP0113_2-20130426/36044_1 /TAXON_ID=91329 /ORGANISM="Norrisiella sphaerica, Strain BC52" /LENGTH=1264 /DNA_ID=CAMNT_0026884281 /DNA_START=49 /DNA_END=3843 /DNA_ORIENTATION=+
MRLFDGLFLYFTAFSGFFPSVTAHPPQISSLASFSPLSKWLYGLSLDLGNITATLAGNNIKLESIKCSRFMAINIGSNFIPPKKLVMQVGNVDFSCIGNYTVDTHVVIIGNLHAEGVFDFSVSASLAVDMEIDTNFSSPLPAVASGTCRTSSRIKKINFHGEGFQSFLIEVLTPLLRPFLPSILDPKVDTWVQKLIASNLTSILNSVDKELEKPIPPPLPIPEMPDTVLNTKIFTNVSQFLENLVGPNGTFNIGKFVDQSTNGTGVVDLFLEMTLGPMKFFGLNTTVMINHVRLAGLNTTEIRSILAPADDFLLYSDASIKFLKLWVNCTVMVFNGPSDNDTLIENIIIQGSASDIALGGSMLVGLDTLSLLELNFFEVGQPKCWPKILHSFNFSYFNASISLDTLDLEASGTLEQEVAGLINTVTRYLLITDQSYISQSLARAANRNLRPIVNSLITSIFAAEESKCILYPTTRFIDWQRFKPIELISLIDDSMLNLVVDQLAPNGYLNLNLNYTTDISADGLTLALRFQELDINGLKNTFYNASLLNAPSSTKIASSLGMGHKEPLNIYLNFGFQLNGANWKNVITNVTLLNVHFSLQEGILINSSLLNLTLLEILNPKFIHATASSASMECFLANYVDAWNFSITDLELDRAHIEFNSKRKWVSLEDLVKQISPTLWGIFESLGSELPETLSEALNSKLQDILYDAPYYCKGQIPPSQSKSGSGGFPSWGIALAVLGSTWVLVITVAFVWWRIYRKRHKEELYYTQMDPRSQEETKYSECLSYTETQAVMQWSSLRAYFPWDEKHGMVIQILIPLFIIATITVKIWALVANVTRVRLSADLPGSSDFFDDYVIDFTFSNMVEYFWKSEAYLISLLIVLGSCILPLALDLFLLLAWFVPMKTSYRGRLLMFFTQSGKGSYIDVMFLCYIVLVMKQKFHVAMATISVTAEPVQGIFGGIASTTMNLLLCQVLWHFHNSLLSEKPHPSRRRRNLWQLHIRRLARHQEENSLKSWVQFVSLVLLFLMASISLVIIVFRSEVTWFRLTGVISELQGPNNYEVIRTYNLYAMPKDIPNNTDQVAGAYVIAISYSLLVLAFPLIMLVVWFALWLVPFKKAKQRGLYTAMYRLWSFCGLEVFWVASFAAVLEINKVAVWVLDHTLKEWCADAGSLQPACNLIEPLSSSGKILHVDAKFLDGGWWLLSQIVLYYGLYNATLYYGGMLLGQTSKGGWKQPPSRPSSMFPQSDPLRSNNSLKGEKNSSNDNK